MVHDARRSVLITGAGRGFGRELVRAFAGRGWRVLALVRSRAAAAAVAAEHPGVCVPIVADVTGAALHPAVSGALVSAGGVLDVLVNNAGSGGAGRTLQTLDPDEVRRLLEVHCLGALRCAQAALPFLGRSRRGLIVNVTSRLGSLGRTAAGEYTALQASYGYRIAKAAQNMLTLCMSQDLPGHGVAVCGVHPGRLLTTNAAPDADTSPGEAAGRLAQWVERAGPEVNGRYFDNDVGEMEW